jgi:hypothetical protein
MSKLFTSLLHGDGLRLLRQSALLKAVVIENFASQLIFGERMCARFLAITRNKIILLIILRILI